MSRIDKTKKESTIKQWIKEHKKISILISLVLLFLIIAMITILVIQFTKEEVDENITDDTIEEDILEEIDEEIEDSTQEIVLLIDLDGLEYEVAILIDAEENVSIVNKSYPTYDSLIEGKTVIDGVKVENGIQVFTDNEILINISKLSEEEQNETISIILENSKNEEEQVQETQEDNSNDSSNSNSGSSSSGSGSTSSENTSSESSSSGSSSSGSSSSGSSSDSSSSESTGTPFSVAYTVERTDIEDTIISIINSELATLLAEDVAELGESVYSWGTCTVTRGTKSEAYSYTSGATYRSGTTSYIGVYKYGKTYYVYAEDIYWWDSTGTSTYLADTEYYLYSK